MPFKEWPKEFWNDLKFEATRPRFVIEILALLGLGIYTYETHRTNNLTEKALENSRVQFKKSEDRAWEQFKTDQRPYMWSSAVVGSTPQANQPLWANVYLVNYGKSPAMAERNTGKIFFGQDATEQADKWFAQMDTGRLDTKDTSVTVVPQGIPANAEKSPVFSSIGTDTALNKSQAEYVKITAFSEVLAVHVEYTDIGGKAFYFSDICYHRTATGQMGICHEHNVMK
jgi:hypothetical protein